MSRVSLLATLGIVFAAAVAQAAPYCVSPVGGPRRCIFFDPNECRLEANRIDGDCTYNGTLTATRIGNKAFCLSTAPGVLLCMHVDRVSCTRDAAIHKAVCVPAPGAAQAPSRLDPFAVQRPY
jgi:hypothetical protein